MAISEPAIESTKPRPALLPALLLALAALGARPAAAGDLLVLRAGRILTAEGAEIEDGVILIESGRIKAVGKDVEVPWDAQVIRFPRGVITPGLIQPHTTAGLRVANENVPEVPYISVLDGVDPNAGEFRAALREGITALHVIPGNATRFGGQGAVLRPVGVLPEAMVVKSPSALKISLAPPGGETRMAHMAQLRRAFLDLHTYLASLQPPSPAALLSTRPAAEPDLSSLVSALPDWKSIDWQRVPVEKIEEQRRPMADLVRGLLPTFIYCPRASDVFKAFELMDADGLKATLVLGPDGYRAAEPLRARKDLGPVVLDPELVRYEEDPETGEERRFLCGRILYDAGVSFALQSREERGGRPGQVLSRDPQSHLWYQAARLLQQGIPASAALRAVTLNPARALGLDHRMGSLAPGKDANLAVFSGDPFDSRSWVDLVVIEGKVVYRRQDDRDLQEILRRPERKF
jgi:imidazolonepropionase-like amidohydrolase